MVTPLFLGLAVVVLFSVQPVLVDAEIQCQSRVITYPTRVALTVALITLGT